MSYDLLVKNGLVVDGTGAAGRRGDVAVADGKIVEIGAVTGGAKTVIDAGGLVVAPGFIDPHTHYDAQICWDPQISPSSWHGVTTVVMGNCGVGIAPCRPQAQEIVTRDLVNVEAIDFEVLERGISWDWETFPQYLDAASRRGSALNLAFLAPLTPFRHYVMGEAALERSANADETARIKTLLGEAVTAGAFGFSTTVMPRHVGYQGRPLACLNASPEEMRAYCNALQELGKGAIEIALTKNASVVDDQELALLDLLVTESRRPVTFLALIQREDMPEAHVELLRRLKPLVERGVVPQTSALPLRRDLSLRAPFFPFGTYECWRPAFNKSKEEQIAVYRDPAFRAAFREELKLPKLFRGRWQHIVVDAVASPALKRHEGSSVAQIAQERGVDAVDAFLDLGLSDDLATEFTYLSANTNDDAVAYNLRDTSVLIGMGDAGAHLANLCDAGYCTYVLGHWVREKGIFSLEEAVRRLTAHPAAIFGIHDRGRLAPGLAADIAIFDPSTVSSEKRPEVRHDLPGGGKRYVMRSIGVEWTIVNGAPVYAKGNATGTVSGQVLRS